MASSHLAARLLGSFDGDTAVTDLLLQRAAPGVELRLVAHPSPAVAIAAAKAGGVKKAVAVATASCDPAVLDQLARDSRLTVRRAVAANPHTGPETLERLLAWAVTAYDECADTLWQRLPLRRAVVVAREHGGNGHRFGRHGDLDDHAEARWASDQRDFAALVPAALAVLADDEHEPVHTVLDDLAGAASTMFADACLAIWNRDTATVTEAIAERIVAAAAHGRSPAFRSKFYRSRITDDARRVLVASRIPALAIPALLGSAPADVRAAAIASGVPEVLEALVHAVKDFDEVAALLDAADALPDPETSRYDRGRRAVDNTGELLEHVPELPTELRLRILRRHHAGLTAKWITRPDEKTAPRPGEVAALFADPGRACSNGPAASVPEPDAVAETVRKFVTELALDNINKRPAVAEAFESADGQVLRWANSACYAYATAGALDTYVTRRFAEAFGAEVRLWDTAMTLAPSWQGRLAQLIDATFTACGIERTAAPREPAVAAEQLALV